MSLMAALYVNVVTVNMLLSVFFLSGVLAKCGEITPGLFITAPKKMEALSGSCLLIPCNFSAKEGTQFDSSREIYGVWIKSASQYSKHDNVIFNSSQTVNSYKMKMIGNLREQNCTTLFSDLDKNKTNKYFFRIENEPFKATACDDPLQITVRDSPWSPTISISGEVKEKKSVTISCSAFTPCPHSPPQLTWNLQQNSHSQIEENTDGTWTSKIQQSITLSDSHDGFNISCSATYPVGEGKPGKTKETQVTLNFPYSPTDTSLLISPTDPVSVGSVVNLTCSCRANPPAVHFVWFMTSDGRLEMIKTDSQVYSFNVTSSDRDRLFYCGCRNHLDIQLSRGRQLMFEGDDQSGNLVSVQVIVKTLGIILLVSTLILFECFFRSRFSTKPAAENVEMSSGGTASSPNK